MIDESLTGKSKEALSGREKVRFFQRKIYLKAKQEVKVNADVSSIAIELSVL